MTDTYTLAELAAETGLSERTIRYYIAQNLIAGPISQGRTAAYSDGHLQVLQRIVEFKHQGLTLDQIRHQLQVWGIPDWALGPGHSGHEVPDPEEWQRYRLTDDVQVDVLRNAAPTRKNLIGRALEQFARAIHIDPDEGEAP